jgi:hypothetical protein
MSPQQIRHRDAGVGLFQDSDNLALAEFRFPHDHS